MGLPRWAAARHHAGMSQGTPVPPRAAQVPQSLQVPQGFQVPQATQPTQVPQARGVRIAWSDLPAEVRAAVAAMVGGEVVEAVTQTGGFSPGVAARLRLSNGGRVFVKAVSAAQNPESPGLYRNEARIAAALP